MSNVKTASQRWQRVKTILADALEIETPKERTAFLEDSCDNDTGLLREIEALLAQETQNLEECAADAPISFARQTSPQLSGERIGAYEIVRELGRGGMGGVYLAKRVDGQFEKEVAIKLLKRGTDTDEILRRFRAERRILARLDHPNIARLLDAGTTDDGLPYFVMEYAEGESITAFVRTRALPLERRLQLFLKICAAVEFAHRKQIIHRDLKPGNIVVTGDGDPKLLDFGIAKLLEIGDDTTEVTLTSERRMTPVCASPEQARGEAVTAASDVYALGALLYELLTEQTSHRFLSSHPSSSEISQVVCEQEPLRPSLTALNAEMRRWLRGDLDNIVLMALRKEPARRYPSVAEFAEDIERHLNGRPVRARPSTAAYLTTRFVARHKQPMGALFGAALVALFFVLFYHPRAPSSQQSASALAPQDKSIAVLPFENLSDDKANANLSEDKGNDVFAAGIQDEVITDLAQVADLKVISRTSVTQYTAAAAHNVRAIAAELGVAHLLTGTVQRAGGRIRVSAQLLNGRTEAHEWAQQYDRDVADVFAIQAELAQSIVAQLQARISPNEMNAMAQQPTSDLVAYDLYLRGKALWDEIATSTDWEGDIRRAIELLERATTHDPNFAIAYGVLCELHLHLYEWVDHSPARLAQANAALQQALRLSPASAETLLAQSEYLGAEKDWKRSLELLQRALRLQPGNAKLFNRMALAKERLGLAQEALRDMEKARDLAPRDPNIPNHLMQMYTRVRDYKKSDEVAEAALASFPNAPSYFRAREVVNSLGRGDLKQARERLALVPAKFDASGFKSLLRIEVPFFARDYEEFDRVAASIPRGNLIRVIETDVIIFEALVAEKRGDTAKKESILNALCATLEAEVRERGMGEGPTNNPTQLANLARVHCYLGKMDDALRESEEAVERTPIAVDALNGPANMSIRAEVLMRTGQTDRAIGLLKQLAQHPYGLSYGELLSLRWDDLRGDPRFQKMVASLKPRPAS